MWPTIVITSRAKSSVEIVAPPVTSFSFDNKVLVEQIRGIESPQALTTDSIDTGSGGDFDGRLLRRAQYLIRQHSLQDTLSHAARIWGYSNILTTLLAVIIGALASLSAVSGVSTLNIYWILLVLVGFNLLSMGLWVVGVCIGAEGLTSGVFSKATAWVPALLGKTDTSKGKADRAWAECYFTGAVGKWRFSQMTQQLWLAYLSAGLGVLVAVLITRQFDFVWGTTLLSDEAFVQLTSILGQPLQSLGFAAPSAQQVMETRIGAGYQLSAEHRYNWAQFLIGALLVFGIIPRLILWLISRALLGVAKSQFVLDNYLPYYIHLRQALMPTHGRSEIVDADTKSSEATPSVATIVQERAGAGQVPATALWVAVELGNAVTWPLLYAGPEHNLGQVVDRASLDAIGQKIQASKGAEVAVVVMASRPPDRGLKRTILSLSTAAEHTWLVLIHTAGEPPVSDLRLAAWYHLARECKVPADHVIRRAGS